MEKLAIEAIINYNLGLCDFILESEFNGKVNDKFRTLVKEMSKRLQGYEEKSDLAPEYKSDRIGKLSVAFKPILHS